MTGRPEWPARLAPAMFALLALATVGAFYLTQHLKTKNPLINGGPRADPAVINPVSAGVCVDAAHKRVSFRNTQLAFYLQARSDVVSVYVISPAGDTVATMAGSGRYVHAGLNRYVYFGWNGRLSDGQVAPAGTYSFRALLQHEGRSVPIDNGTVPVTVQVTTARPRPRVSAISVQALTPPAGQTTSTASATSATVTSTSATSASATSTSATSTSPTSSGRSATPGGTTPSFTPGPQAITITTNIHGNQGAEMLIYRAAPNGTLRLVKQFGTSPHRHLTGWDGLIDGRPAPAGTYLVGLSLTDASCTSARFPVVLDPVPGSTDGAGVNVSYLSVTPPLTPTPAGQLADVAVGTGGAPFHWALRRASTGATVFHGTDPGSGHMVVRLPGIGLYTLTVVSGAHRSTVPLVASGVGARATAGVLVVLPALSWQGENATDDSSDGLIDTLANGAQIDLERPLVAGLPAGFGDEAALLGELDRLHLDYDLTTDVALAEGVGPSLTDRHGVLLDGQVTWLPGQLVGALRSFVSDGGGFFNAGIDSLEATALIADGDHGPIAGPARHASTDLFGVSHATPASAEGQSIFPVAGTDALGIFSTLSALQYPSYQVLEPPSGRVLSAAGVAASAPAVIGFRRGRGTVVEAGLPDFGLSLAGDVDAQELLTRVWQTVLR